MLKELRFYPEFPNEELISSDDIKAFYTHGHLYSVNRGRQQLAERAAQEGCQFAFTDILMWLNMNRLDLSM